jgi:hypothetical protein
VASPLPYPSQKSHELSLKSTIDDNFQLWRKAKRRFIDP